MASFRYKVLKKDGSLAEGSLEAGSRGEATRRLNEQGSRVLSLTEEALKEKAKKKPAKPGTPDKPARKATSAPVENRLSSKQLVQFTEELSDLLAAGVQLDAALHSIGKRSESQAISRVAGACYEKVRDGVPLATALRLSSPSFNELYCNLVSAGEISGALGDILKRQVKYLNTLAELRGKLATALIYPAFLIVSGVGVSAMFVFFLIPKLRRLVESTGGELPPVAKLLLSTGDFLKANWIAVLVVLLVAVVVVFVAFQRESTKRWWDEAKLKLPLFGKLLVTRFNVQFVETLANLLVNGLPIVRALELVETTTPNRYIREQIIQMRARVSEGAMLNRCMEKAGIFESGLVDMTRIGEDTGQLAPSIAKAGDRLDREFGRAIERIASVIQPAIILVMSVVVGLMAYMMISVIYETISVLRNR
jgi:general secretion pathway protein F/type IV pilus assembly protein PilC